MFLEVETTTGRIFINVNDIHKISDTTARDGVVIRVKNGVSEHDTYIVKESYEDISARLGGAFEVAFTLGDLEG